MKNEKPVATNNGLINIRINGLTMDNNKPNQNNFQFNSRRELLEQAKLSRLPQRQPFTLPGLSDAKASGCLACGGRLDVGDAVQEAVKVCRKCLTQYAVIDAAIDAASKRKRQAMLERFAPEVNER